MQYTYEFELYRGQEQWVIEAYDFPACITQGEDVADACESAADVLRELARDALMGGRDLPASTFGHDPANGGMNVVVSVEASLDAVRKVSATEAARRLGVGRSRVTARLDSGLLDGWRDGRNTWVTVDSIEARLVDKPKPGRPKKSTALVQPNE